MTDVRTEARILLVDDDTAVAELLRRLLAKEGFSAEIAGDAQTAFASIAKRPPDLVLLDVMLPGMSGFDICRRLKRDPATRLTPVILITGLDEREKRIEGLEAGADDFLTKPVAVDELRARVRSLVRMKRFTDELDSASSIIMALAVLIEERDGNTEGHCHRMANYATALGRAVSLGEEDLQALYRGGFLHDVGMLSVPDSVLRKNGRLNDDEYTLVKSHTVVGESLCGNLRSLQNVRPIIRSHHERLDGSGYPDGTRGDAVPLLAQIIGIVDVYDAVTTRRAYQNTKPSAEAVAILRDHVRRGWRRPDLVNAFAGLVEAGRFETFRG